MNARGRIASNSVMYLKSRDIRPTCVNHGCGKPAASDHKKGDGTNRWRVHCSHCQGASYGRHPHQKGVTPFKKGICSNIDSHLGFPCPIDWKKIPSWAKGKTEIDHKDGNCNNNRIDNLDELCPMCHKFKSQLTGDHDNTRRH